ncbi:hypothetical protein FJZ48_00355 [Candidatus Uhrbacteria bacterium]|nr:hypothetical protein [Candidatus Uhrbacteria bacterium]
MDKELVQRLKEEIDNLGQKLKIGQRVLSRMRKSLAEETAEMWVANFSLDDGGERLIAVSREVKSAGFMGWNFGFNKSGAIVMTRLGEHGEDIHVRELGDGDVFTAVDDLDGYIYHFYTSFERGRCDAWLLEQRVKYIESIELPPGSDIE